MQSSLVPSTTFTRKAEGLWANNPADPGGATMEGITLTTYRAWCKAMGMPVPSAADLHAITDAHWNAITVSGYWNPVLGNELPAGADLSVYDMAFNASPHTSGRILQETLGFTGDDVDGWVGPDTVAATVAKNGNAFILKLAAAQLSYYRGLENWATFGHGWTNRTNARQAAALALLIP